jgi:hypothetical protein
MGKINRKEKITTEWKRSKRAQTELHHMGHIFIEIQYSH